MISVQRTAAALQLHNSPLILVLAQLRMTPILNLESYVPKLQDRLRTCGFPRVRTRTIKLTAVDPMGQAQVSESKDWVFGDRAGYNALVVGDRSLALVTSAYSRFEDFVQRLQEGLEIVHEVVRINGVERQGLRYVDLIEPTEDKPLSYYLQPSLLGLPLEALGSRVSNTLATIVETSPNRKLVVRATERLGGFVMPPDLLTLQLTLRKPNEIDHPFAVLDLDHFVEYPDVADYETETVLETFCDLHDPVDQAFRKATTTAAIQDWKGHDARN